MGHQHHGDLFFTNDFGDERYDFLSVVEVEIGKRLIQKEMRGPK